MPLDELRERLAYAGERRLAETAAGPARGLRVSRPARTRRVGVPARSPLLLATAAPSGLPAAARRRGRRRADRRQRLTPAVATAGDELQVTGHGDQQRRPGGPRRVGPAAAVRHPAEQPGRARRCVAGHVPAATARSSPSRRCPTCRPGGTGLRPQPAAGRPAALTGFGVYVLGVEVVGARGDGTGRVAITRTLLPVGAAPPRLQPDRVQLAVAAGRAPVRLADGTFADDSLATELAPGGRLDRLLHAGAALGRARPHLGVDPDLLETVADMADATATGSPPRTAAPSPAAERCWPGAGWTGCGRPPPGERRARAALRRPGPVALVRHGAAGRRRPGPRPSAARSGRPAAGRQPGHRTSPGRSTATSTGAPWAPSAGTA